MTKSIRVHAAYVQQSIEKIEKANNKILHFQEYKDGFGRQEIIIIYRKKKIIERLFKF